MAFEKFCDFYAEFTPATIALRLLFAAIFGGIIGLERASRHHTAGIRTFALVCLGSALAAVANIYLGLSYEEADMSRIPAQVVSGIGFLGAGTIIITGKNQVKGLTTAASLWVTASLGIVLGTGMLKAGIMGFVLTIMIVLGISYLSRYYEKNNKFIDLYLEIDKSKINEIYSYISDHSYEVVSMEKKRDKTLRSSEIVLLLVLNLQKRTQHAGVLAQMSQIEGVHYMEEL